MGAIEERDFGRTGGAAISESLGPAPVQGSAAAPHCYGAATSPLIVFSRLSIQKL